MSETIAIALSETGAPEFLATLDAISQALHISDLRCSEDVPGPGTPWPPGIWHLFREGVSTRTTEITVDETEFAVRIFSMASHEDVRLPAIRHLDRLHAAIAGIERDVLGNQRQIPEIEGNNR